MSTTSSGSFVVDPSLASDVHFAVYYYDLNHVGNKIELSPPSGDVILPQQEEDSDVNMIFVKIENAEVRLDLVIQYSANMFLNFC